MKRKCSTLSSCGEGPACPSKRRRLLRTTPSRCKGFRFTDSFRDEQADTDRLPIGRTCFFRLEIPAYKSEDAFKEKLLYAIRFCTDIDADIEGAVQREEESPVDEVVNNEESQMEALASEDEEY